MSISVTAKGDQGGKNVGLASIIDSSRVILTGYTIIGVFLLVFVVWAGTMPLSNAAIAPGVVGVEGQKKIIQHVDGGIVRDIHVADGDAVTVGQALVTLDGVDIRSLNESLEVQVIQRGVELARWDAARVGSLNISLPAWLDKHVKLDLVSDALATQKELLEAGHAVMQEKISELDYQFEQAEEESKASRSRIEILENKKLLVEQELVNLTQVARSGLVTRSQLFELEKELSDLLLDIDESQSAITQATVQRGQITARINEVVNSQRQLAIEQSTLARNKLDILKQQLAVSANQLRRLSIVSPIDGFVVSSRVHTIGGVIKPGEPIMELVPSNERLLIESKVEPKDRDTVRVGQKAEVRFSAFDKRSTRPVEGIVRMISADRVIDPATQLGYYNTVVELVEDPQTVLGGAQIHPGMQTDVLIVTGEQTLLQYLLSPLSRSFNRAMREE